MKCIIYALATLIILPGCHQSFISKNVQSELRNGEVFSVKLEHVHSENPPLLPNGESSNTESLAAVIAPIAVDYALRFVTSEVEREATRYQAEYSAASADDWFFQTRKSPSQINLKSITLERTYVPQSSSYSAPSDEGTIAHESRNDTTAMRIQFEVKQAADMTHFRLVPTSFKLSAAAAKLKRRDETLDLQIELFIDFFYLEFDEDGYPVAKAITAEVPPLQIKNAQLNTEWDGTDDDMPRALAGISSHFFAIPPRTVFELTSGTLYGLGCYAVRARVTESDSFGDTVQEFSEFLEKDETKSGIQEQILEWLGIESEE